MAVYRLGDMVRMRREALGMTQSELVQIYEGKGAEEEQASAMRAEAHGGHKNEICSVQVLRRIENGGVGRVKIDVFRRLMIKMGVLPERIYASLLVTDCRALRLKSEIHVHMNRREYGEAEKKLKELEPMLVPDYPRNRQYQMAVKAKLAYKKGEMEAGEYLTMLLDALRYTVPKLDEIDIAGWPFNVNEFDILLEIANAYHSMKEKKAELEFLLKMKKNVERKYMDEDHYVVWHVCAMIGLSQLMCLTGQHEKSMEYCETGIEECRKQRILGDVFRFLYDIVWNRETLISKGMFSENQPFEQQEAAIKKERAFCRKQLVQGYYLSVAQGDIYEAERIKRLYERNYPKAVKLL